jgi:hypothetical protein
MKQKLQEYALIAEIVSAIAIVISLIFVGMQVRLGASETAANTEALRSQVRESMLASDLSLLQNYIDYPEGFNEVNINQGLTPAEIQRQAFLLLLIRTRENYWLQYNNGALDEDTFISYLIPFIRSVTVDEFWASVWAEVAIYGVNPDFVDYVNSLIEAQTYNMEPD